MLRETWAMWADVAQVATGVRLENGEVIKPSGAIISSAGIVPTYAHMLPPKVT